MKIETFKINLAVADGVDREELETLVCLMLGQGIKNVFGVEIEGGDRTKNSKRTTARPKEPAEEPAEETPRKKRKYTRRQKAVEEAEKAGVKIRRVDRGDGTVVEQRGNCQGGGAV